MERLVFEWNSFTNLIDYLRIHILLPEIGIRRGTNTISDQDTLWIGVYAPTTVCFSLEEDVGWSVAIRLFGLGVSIQRQWSY